jgi:hypothetical protein
LFTAKKQIIQNESGNIIIVIALIGMIAGLIGYWTSLSDKTDKEIRSLGTIQSATFMRADFKNTIKKSLNETNTACPLIATFKSKFKNFNVATSDALITKVYEDNISTDPFNEISDPSATNYAETKCFFNINRYAGLKWEKLKISIRRTTEPNYMSLANFISVDIQAVFRVGGKPTVLKYQLKYRIDVLTMDRYGVIFTNSGAGDVFTIPSGSSVNINSPVLFDYTGRSTGTPLALKNLIALPVDGRLIFSKEAFTTAPSLNSSTPVINFLTTKTLYHVFRQGLEYGHLPGGAFKPPYEINSSQWTELLDFTHIKNSYALPNSTPEAIVYNDPDIVHKYSLNPGDNSNTASIYNRIAEKTSGEENTLLDSCRPATDITSGPYPLLIHNNISTNFTIDFSNNTDSDHPPVFCGVIVAKDLKIILNGQNSTQDFYRHHVIGKFILSGKIQIVNAGSLSIHDLSQFTEDTIDYAGITMNITNLRTQYFNQKYYSTQNFFLPFFKTYPTLLSNDTELQLSTNLNRYYFPRSTRSFFSNSPCGPGSAYRCRTPNIPVPAKEDLVHAHWGELMYEVYDLE